MIRAAWPSDFFSCFMIGILFPLPLQSETLTTTFPNRGLSPSCLLDRTTPPKETIKCRPPLKFFWRFFFHTTVRLTSAPFRLTNFFPLLCFAFMPTLSGKLLSLTPHPYNFLSPLLHRSPFFPPLDSCRYSPAVLPESEIESSCTPTG